MVDTIRSNSKTGRPCGDDGFMQTIEGIVGRRLKAMPKGRPRRNGISPYHFTQGREGGRRTYKKKPPGYWKRRFKKGVVSCGFI